MSSLLRRATVGAGTLKAFRLSDLPARVREYGVFEFERIEVALGSDFWALTDQVSEMKGVAEHPSDRVYYIPLEAWEKVERKFKVEQVAA